MVPRAEGSQLKRARPSTADSDGESFKKPRRTERAAHKAEESTAQPKTPVDTKQQLPSPITHNPTEGSFDAYKEGTVTPPEGRPSQVAHRSPVQGFSSPPQDTQATQAIPSQIVDPKAALSDEVEDEVKEGVWGYLFPLDTRYGGKCVVLRKRGSCPMPDTNGKSDDKPCDKASKGFPSGGYLIGRHPECV
ncbi:hypothetical protein MCOR32_008159 [Pyricularia oryzae]|nr:hypothetical protein MCOR32_008159 [Pyricularia oryzae]